MDVGGWERYGEHWRFFYDCMLAPVPKQLEAALERLPIVSHSATPSYKGKSGFGVVKVPGCARWVAGWLGALPVQFLFLFLFLLSVCIQ